MPVPTQLASVAAWNEDEHAVANRRLYQQKFARVLPILAAALDVQRPDGAFYLWPHVGEDDEHFTRQLFAEQNLTVLPGSYLARESHGVNPGRGRVRISLTASLDQCVEAARRIRAFVDGRK
jgi:N-succinyldiaminopimelate aminotransferase